MELVKTVLRLDLGEAFNPWLELRNVIRGAVEKDTAEIQGAPMVMNIPEKKQRVEFHIRALVFHQEGIASINETVDIALKKVERINGESRIPRINKMLYESEFIQPYSLPFHEMLLLIKERFLVSNSMVNRATDVGLIFDEVQDGVLKHMQFGPMEREQLLSVFLIYKPNEIPDNFVFALNRYEISKNVDYSEAILKEFLDNATNWQIENTSSLFNYLKQKGI